MLVLRKTLLRTARPILSRTFYRPGTVRSIVSGPGRGLRYRIFPGYGLSPLYGGWEADAQREMQKCIKPGDVVYDIGANYGIHTLLLARLVGSAGWVYSFEPMPSIYNQLCENVAFNRFLNVTTLPVAVADSTGNALFQAGHHEGAGHLLTSGAETSIATVVVPTTTIDDLVFTKGYCPPQFIKLDVEGAESRVLAAAWQTLVTHRPVLLIELHTPEQDIAVGRILIEAGYIAYRISDGLKVRDLSKGWPNPEGLWGQFVAYP
jgi:FkbM family methyltransferase